MTNLLIAGCGYVGTALGLLMANTHTVWGLRRGPEVLPAPLSTLHGDLSDPTLQYHLASAAVSFDAVVFSAAAPASQEAEYVRTYVEGSANLLRALHALGQAPRRAIFVSSTGVYGQDDGTWVDEDAPTTPSTFRGRTMLAAERLWRMSRYNACVLRLGGIYGPGRTSLLQRLRDGTAVWPTQRHYTNRIHRDDAAGAIAHVLRLPMPAPVYIVVDNEPAEQSEVLNTLAAQLGVPAAAPLPATGPATGKRCSNATLRNSGYALRFPTFREGYRAV